MQKSSGTTIFSNRAGSAKLEHSRRKGGLQHRIDVLPVFPLLVIYRPLRTDVAIGPISIAAHGHEVTPLHRRLAHGRNPIDAAKVEGREELFV